MYIDTYMHITKSHIPTTFRATKSRALSKPTPKVGYLWCKNS